MRKVGRMLGQRFDLKTLFQPLQIDNYRFLWFGNLISLVGDQFQIIAMTLLVLNVTQGATDLGIILMFQALPRVVFSLVSGIAIDHFSARKVLIVSNLVQGILVAGLCVLAVGDELNLWHLYIYALISGTALAFSYPAGNSMIPELVPPSQVRSANALSATVFSLSRFVVPAIAAWVVAAAGIASAFGINALTFVLAVLFVALIHLPAEKTIRDGLDERDTSWWKKLATGFNAARKNSVIWIAIIISLIYSLGYYGVALL